MSVELEEVEPGRWRVKKARVNEKLRAENMPLPFVISDNMEPVEQVDGRFYTSKSAFRRVGRQLGLIEIGTEKLIPKARAKPDPRPAIKKALEQYKEAATHQEAVERYTPGVRDAK